MLMGINKLLPIPLNPLYNATSNPTSLTRLFDRY